MWLLPRWGDDGLLKTSLFSLWDDGSPCWCCMTTSEETRRPFAAGGAGILVAAINHGALSAAEGIESEWIQDLDTAAAFGREFLNPGEKRVEGAHVHAHGKLFAPYVSPVGCTEHTKVSNIAADNGKCEILSAASLSFLFLWLVTEKRANSEPPYVYPLPPRKIGKRVKTGSWLSSLSTPIRNLLWTMTSCERTWQTEEACHDEHKPGSGGRLPLIQRFFCKSAVGRFWCWRIRDHLRPSFCTEVWG